MSYLRFGHDEYGENSILSAAVLDVRIGRTIPSPLPWHPPSQFQATCLLEQVLDARARYSPSDYIEADPWGRGLRAPRAFRNRDIARRSLSTPVDTRRPMALPIEEDPQQQRSSSRLLQAPTSSTASQSPVFSRDASRSRVSEPPSFGNLRESSSAGSSRLRLAFRRPRSFVRLPSRTGSGLSNSHTDAPDRRRKMEVAARATITEVGQEALVTHVFDDQFDADLDDFDEDSMDRVRVAQGNAHVQNSHATDSYLSMDESASPNMLPTIPEENEEVHSIHVGELDNMKSPMSNKKLPSLTPTLLKPPLEVSPLPTLTSPVSDDATNSVGSAPLRVVDVKNDTETVPAAPSPPYLLGEGRDTDVESISPTKRSDEEEVLVAGAVHVVRLVEEDDYEVVDELIDDDDDDETSEVVTEEVDELEYTSDREKDHDAVPFDHEDEVEVDVELENDSNAEVSSSSSAPVSDEDNRSARDEESLHDDESSHDESEEDDDDEDYFRKKDVIFRNDIPDRPRTRDSSRLFLSSTRHELSMSYFDDHESQTTTPTTGAASSHDAPSAPLVRI